MQPLNLQRQLLLLLLLSPACCHPPPLPLLYSSRQACLQRPWHHRITSVCLVFHSLPSPPLPSFPSTHFPSNFFANIFIILSPNLSFLNLSDLQVAIDKSIRLTEELNDERESRHALLQLMQSSAASPDTRRMAQLELRCSQLQQQLRVSSGLVKSLSEEVAAFRADSDAKGKRIALLEMLLSDHQLVVSSRYAGSESVPPALLPAAAPRPLATLRGGASSGVGVSTTFLSWLKGVGGAGHVAQ